MKLDIEDDIKVRFFTDFDENLSAENCAELLDT